MDISVPASWLLVAMGMACLALWGWWRAATRITRGNRRRQERARRGEDAAERLLAREGFHVVDRQVGASWTMWIDDEPIEVRCRADLLVEGPGGRYIAEVKTGERATDPTLPATRRQLLEYQLAFPVDGVALVDMEASEVRFVSFDPGEPGWWLDESLAQPAGVPTG